MKENSVRRQGYAAPLIHYGKGATLALGQPTKKKKRKLLGVRRVAGLA
jgi:hypothetical protein